MLSSMGNIKTDNVKEVRVYCDFRNHRIGDKVVCSAALKWYKDQHPQDWLIAVDDFWFEKGKQHTIPSNVIFKGVVDECVYNKTPVNATRLEFGCLWLRVPWLAKQGCYPSITLNNECEKQMLDRFRWMSDPYVCVHILENAPYKRKRNHDFRQMRQLLRVLSRHRVNVVRIGQDSGCVVRGVTDLTPYNLSVMESACVIKHSTAYIGGDTGMTHIASAVGVPWILAIYGSPDNPEPWRNQAQKIGCGDIDFCALPSVPEEDRLTVFRMRNHKFMLADVVNTCLGKLTDLGMI